MNAEDLTPEQQQQMLMNMEQRVLLAKIDMETRQRLYDSMVTNCFKKCVEKLNYDVDSPEYNWGELSIKEMSCTDRCTQKYIQSQEISKKRMEKHESAKMEQVKLAEKSIQKISSVTSIFTNLFK